MCLCAPSVVSLQIRIVPWSDGYCVLDFRSSVCCLCFTFVCLLFWNHMHEFWLFYCVLLFLTFGSLIQWLNLDLLIHQVVQIHPAWAPLFYFSSLFFNIFYTIFLILISLFILKNVFSLSKLSIFFNICFTCLFPLLFVICLIVFKLRFILCLFYLLLISNLFYA